MTGQCDARVSPRLGGARCQFAAKHTHLTGDFKLRLCDQHYRVITQRGHLGDEVELIKRWLG